MEKLKMHSPDLTQDNIARIRKLVGFYPEITDGCLLVAGGSASARPVA